MIRDELVNFDPRGSCEPRPRNSECPCTTTNFDPRGSCEPRQLPMKPKTHGFKFRSTRLLRASTIKFRNLHYAQLFRSTRLLRASTVLSSESDNSFIFRSTRLLRASTCFTKTQRFEISDFDPRGSCEPRLERVHAGRIGKDFDPRGSCEPRLQLRKFLSVVIIISIHEALASLDGT